MTTTADLLRTAGDALDAARDRVLQRSVGRVRAKTERDFVSDLDVAVERDVRTLLADRAPEIGFLGEEEGWARDSDRGRFWVLDPLDGTTNVVKELPLCAVSLALVDHDRTVLGVIDAPFLALRYHGVAGDGAYLDGKRLRASSTERLADAVVAMGDYAVGDGAEDKNEVRLAITAQLAARVQRVRMFGTAALDLAWVAEGKLDASVILSNKPWDTAAGVLLAREAGAEVVDTDRSPHTIHSASTITAPGSLLGDLLGLVGQAMGNGGGMSINGVLPGIAVADFEGAIGWWSKLLGRPPDEQPMAGLADWHISGAGVIQVIQDPERAGKSMLTLSVGDLVAYVAALADRGIPAGRVDITTSDKVLIATVEDPEGNHVTLLQPRS